MKRYFNEIFQPKVLELFQKGKYNKSLFTSDLIAGIIVGIVALPLAIAFGIASGVTPQQGLITAIVAGFLISLFGGSHFLIGGPTGAFIVIVYGIVAQYGTSGLIIATLMAGIILVLMGAMKLGNVFRFIPYPIIVGFTSGIAVVIFSTQIKEFFGLTIAEVPSEFIPQWATYISHFSTISLPETLMSLTCLLTIIFWPRLSRTIPGSLIAIIIGTLGGVVLHQYFDIELATIGSKFPELANGVPMPSPQMPQATWQQVQELIQPAITIAILCAIESLLAAMVADGVTGKRHNSNTELIGQGIANIITPFFGGIPATGAIARTMTSINNGGKSPLTGLIHAVVLLLIFLFLMPYAVYIPLSCLAAILVVVAYNMSEWRTFKYLLKGERSDVLVLLTTFFLTVIVDLTIAIEVGLLFAVLLFVKRVSETSSVSHLEGDIANTENEELAENPDIEHLKIPAGVEVYEVDGPFFFGLASKLDEIDRDLGGTNSTIRVIRMRKVPFMDSTGLHNLSTLIERSHKEGIDVVLSGVTERVRKSLIKSGFDSMIGSDMIQPNIYQALEKAQEVLDNRNI